jgi:hypothetical protein
MENGEAVSIPEFLEDELHNEKTCPWHTKGDSQSRRMEPQNPDEDVEGGMPPNDGGKLGKNGCGSDPERWVS